MSSITYDTSVSGQIPDGTQNIPITIGSNPNSIVLFAQYESNLVSVPAPSPTFAGTSMGLVIAVSGVHITDDGIMQVWQIMNPPSGSQTITINNTSDSIVRQYAAYSYYNTSGVDASGGNSGSYSSGFVSSSLSAFSNNTLMWAIGGARSTSGFTPSTVGPSNNLKNAGVNPFLGAGDFGIQATPASETMNVGNNSSVGNGCVALIALAPVFPPATATGGSFLTMMI